MFYTHLLYVPQKSIMQLVSCSSCPKCVFANIDLFIYFFNFLFVAFFTMCAQLLFCTSFLAVASLCTRMQTRFSLLPNAPVVV